MVKENSVIVQTNVRWFLTKKKTTEESSMVNNLTR